MIEVRLGEGVREAYTGWRIGLLEMEGLVPRRNSPELEAEARRVEEALKAKFGGKSRKELAAIPPIDGYDDYFRHWGKAYPVLLQIEAVASRGRRLEMPDPLVLAMFATELDGFLLTAGHDVGALRPPLVLDEADGKRRIPTLGGTEKTPPFGDLTMSDAEGIVASVLLGPDSRTGIASETSRALFVVYAPISVGDGSLERGLEGLAATIGLACPGASRVGREILSLGRGIAS
jgi:DNA/RNA-binding domain of Phe-tRNA-synthetase-like protein